MTTEPVPAEPPAGESRSSGRRPRVSGDAADKATAEWIARRDALYQHTERIAEVERQICSLQADQVDEVAAFIDERTAFDHTYAGAAGPEHHRSMVAEVALARGVSVITAGSFMSDAWLLSRSCPHTMQALRSGRLGLSAARSIANEIGLLDDPERRREAERLVAEEAVDVLPGKVPALAARRVAAIDPTAASRRREREQADRHVRLTNAGSAMTYLDAYLPAEQGAACVQSLRQLAKAARASGDQRTTGQIMADTLVARVTGLSKPEVVPVHVNVVMTDATLLALDDAPAHLDGIGPLPAPVARLLATSESAWLRRFCTDPVDGTVSDIDTRRRRFDGALRELIMLRDQHCQGIACASPIRDVDHIIEHAVGGRTTRTNGQGLSQNCHIGRSDRRMTVSREPGSGVVVWQTPVGLEYRSLPPPALGSGSGDASQVRLRHRLLHPPDSRVERRFFAGMVGHLRDAPRR